MDVNRKARKTELEEREAAAKKHFMEVRIAKRKKDEALALLKAEGRKRMRLDEDACDPDRAKAVGGQPVSKKPATAATEASQPLLLKWSKKHKGAISYEDLSRHLQLAGALVSDFEIDMIIVKEKSAVITFKSEQQRGVAMEWLKSESNRRVTGIKVEVVGLDKAAPVSETASAAPPPPQASTPVGLNTSFNMSAAPAGDDYENLTMMRMRQAAERQRLAQQIADEDD